MTKRSTEIRCCTESRGWWDPGEIVFREWICEMQSELSSGCRVLTLQGKDIGAFCSRIGS